LNPDLVVCSISGFGQTGPLRDRVAYDVVNQAMSGILSMNGEPAGPPVRLALPVGDIAGGVFAVIAILSGLWGRERGRRSKPIDIALHDGLISMLGYMATLYDMNGKTPEKTGSRHPSVVPYGTFQTKDGWFAIAIFSTKFWVNFCKAAGRPELASDARFKRARDRMVNRADLESLVEKIILERTTAEWDELCREADIPASPVLTVPEALEHPQTKARGMYWTLSHPAYGSVRVAGTPFHRGGRNSEHPSPPPLLGENTAEVLREYLDLDEERLLALHRSGVVKIAQEDEEASAALPKVSP
jgi:formyl-CoA transferase/CoA:oxalate CoA-transferase